MAEYFGVTVTPSRVLVGADTIMSAHITGISQRYVASAAALPVANLAMAAIAFAVMGLLLAGGCDPSGSKDMRSNSCIIAVFGALGLVVARHLARSSVGVFVSCGGVERCVARLATVEQAAQVAAGIQWSVDAARRGA